MSMTSMICPSCGAPVTVPFGRSYALCEYCGSQVKVQLTEAEARVTQKTKEFIDNIRASMHCIVSGDFSTAMDYAEKAAALIPADPAPAMIKYVSSLREDFRKAQSFYSIASNLRKESESIAFTEEDYESMLEAFAGYYLSERDGDFNRVFMNNKKAKAGDIQVIRQYQFTKNLSDYYTHPELKKAFIKKANKDLDESIASVNGINQVNQTNWDNLLSIRNGPFLRSMSVVLVDPSLAPKASDFVNKYYSALDMKWESGFKKEISNGSKDQIKQYRSEAEACKAWLKIVK